MLKSQAHALAPSQLVASSGLPATVLGGDKQYAVLLLNEEQLGDIMQRQGMRQVNRRMRPVGDAYAAYTRLKRRTMAGVGALVVIVAAGVLWAWAPVSALAAVFPWTRSAAPTVATGASFSLTMAARRSAGDAAVVAGRLRGLGLPAFTHVVPGSRAHQVMVGPYVSLDEAERQQRRLSGNGFGGARMFVDESLRDAPRNTLVATAADNPGIVLVGGPERVSLVFEMTNRPRQVSTRRVGDTTLQVDIGPLDATVAAQQWSAPGGVELISHVAVEETTGGAAGRFAQARIGLPASAQATTRVEGRRVYVDVTWAPGDESDVAAATPAQRVPSTRAAMKSADGTTHGKTASAGEHVVSRAAAPVTMQRAAPVAAAVAPAAPAAPAVDAYEPLRPVMARFHEVMPFVLSATASPSSEILGALATTLASLDVSLRGMTMTGDAAAAQGLLLSATAAARRAVDAGFAGDRLAEAHRAAGLFEAARGQVR